MKTKINYFFFIWTIVLPLGVGTLATLIWWPAIHSHYWEVIMSPTTNIVVGYVLMFALMWVVVVYMAIPWLIVIRDDKIIFHRLFRRKLVIPFRDIKKIEVLTNKVPVRNFPWSIANIIFYRENMKLYVVGVPHYAIIGMYKVFEKQGIIFEESTRKPSKEELEELIIR